MSENRDIATAASAPARGWLDGAAPPDRIEQAVAGIWATVLGVDRVDVHDNFLLLGGESLLATQVASQIRQQLQVEVSIRSILVGTVAEVAVEVAALLAASPA